MILGVGGVALVAATHFVPDEPAAMATDVRRAAPLSDRVARG